MIIPTYTEWLLGRLQTSHYAPYLHADLEYQFQPVPVESDEYDDLITDLSWPISGQPHKHRTPYDGRTNPTDNDTLIDYHPDLIDLAGTSWWNWRAGQTEGCAFDFDFGHGGKGLDEAGIARIDEYAEQLPYVTNSSSKGGRGRHWFVHLTNPLPARIRGEHKHNCDVIMDTLSTDLGFDLRPLCCSYGQIQYIYSRDLFYDERLNEDQTE